MTSSVLKKLCGAFLFGILGACGLPEADGTEAEIASRAAPLKPLAAARGSDPVSVVHNGLLLNPAVRAAASEVAASADEIRVQRAAFFPSLGISLGGGAGGAGSGKPALTLSGNQLLTDFGKTDRAITAADVDLQIRYISFQSTVDDAIVELLTAYEAVQSDTRTQDIRRQQLAAMRNLAELVEERISAGAAANTDILETRKRLQTAEFLLQDAELTLADARDRLMRLSGQAQGGTVPPLHGSCRSVPDSYDLQIARLRVIKADLDLRNAESSRMPRIGISPLARARVGGGGGLGLNLDVDSDFLQGGAYTARANAARNAGAAARASVDATSRDDALDTRKLQRDMAAAARRREMLERQISLLAETRTLYRNQYFELGTRQISDLLDNEDEYYERQAELVALGSDVAAYELDCAVRARSLRQSLRLGDQKIYGFPLAQDKI